MSTLSDQINTLCGIFDYSLPYNILTARILQGWITAHRQVIYILFPFYKVNNVWKFMSFKIVSVIYKLREYYWFRLQFIRLYCHRKLKYYSSRAFTPCWLCAIGIWSIFYTLSYCENDHDVTWRAKDIGCKKHLLCINLRTLFWMREKTNMLRKR